MLLTFRNLLSKIRRLSCGSQPFRLTFCSNFFPSRMRLTSALNAHGFGTLYKINGIVTYKLSPFEQKAFAGAISKGVPNMFRRFRSNVFIVAPPFIVGYLVYNLAEAEHARLLRKNPADYANDQ